MINQAQLIGRLGKEPEIKTGENYTLATFSLDFGLFAEAAD